jgi:PAS domain S-box-containing protein
MEDSSSIIFEELFDLNDIQRLQDEFAMATGVASIITHTDGTPITRPSNFCRLCIDIIRKTDQGLINCFNSDAELGRFRPDGPTIQPCLSGGLWDAGAAISVNGKHLANWLIGQVRDEMQTEEKMREYARQIGANEDTVLDAFRKVPAMSRLQFGQVAQVLYTLAHQLSTTAYQNVQQARFITELKRAEEELRESEQQQRELLEQMRVDMAERKRAEQALRESEERFRVVFERSPLGKSLTAPDGALLQINQAFADLLGYTVAEMQQLNFAEVTHPEDLAGSQEIVRCLLANEQSNYRMQKRYIHKNGKLIWTEVNTTLLRDPDGKPLYFITSIADINERVQAEEELRKYHERLEDLVAKRTVELSASNKELESFSYSASHDLRAPLRAMEGFSHILLEEYGDQLDETGKGYLLRIRSASQRMGELIDNMLKLARITRTELSVQTVNLSELVRSIADSLSQNQPEQSVEVIIQEGILGQGDKYLLTIALDNLLGNAWKFTSKQYQGRIEFGMMAQEGERVYFVRDNGIGFDMKYVEKLFVPFQRLHSEKEYPGTGIGLSIVQRIVQRHGGRIWAEAEIGKGTVFYFTLG